MTDHPVPADGPGRLAPRPAPGLERPWPGPQLTPEQRQARRKNRRWMLFIAIPSLIVVGLALLTNGVAANNAPKATTAIPAGYRAIDDQYFAYAVPSTWSTDNLYTDSTGDLDTAGSSGWVGEHLGYRTAAPVLGEPQPASLESFGEERPTPYQLSGGHPISVPGASALAYTMTRPGFRATAVDAWNGRYGVEIWMVIAAPPAMSAQILASLRT